MAAWSGTLTFSAACFPVRRDLSAEGLSGQLARFRGAGSLLHHPGDRPGASGRYRRKDKSNYLLPA
jgi:hypothetical protein